MTATLFRHLNEQGYKFSMITTGISSHVRYLLEEEGARLLSLSYFVERRPLLKHPFGGLFFSTSVALNETENLNIWSKLNQ